MVDHLEKFEDRIDKDKLIPIIEKCDCIISELSDDDSEKYIYYKLKNTMIIIVELIKKREQLEIQKEKKISDIKISEFNITSYNKLWIKKCWQFHNLMIELNEITSEKFLPEDVFYKVSPSSSGHI